MPRFQLIPVLTGDGRRIILQAVPLGRGERVRELIDRIRGKDRRRR
jgi:hypothetical protein